jgi:hypothetical protein
MALAAATSASWSATISACSTPSSVATSLQLGLVSRGISPLVPCIWPVLRLSIAPSRILVPWLLMRKIALISVVALAIQLEMLANDCAVLLMVAPVL